MRLLACLLHELLPSQVQSRSCFGLGPVNHNEQGLSLQSCTAPFKHCPQRLGLGAAAVCAAGDGGRLDS